MSAADVPVSECDKSYWRETGLASKVYPRKINIFKTAFGAGIYTIMKKVMSKNYKTEKTN
jgi:hypothetical protein